MELDTTDLSGKIFEVFSSTLNSRYMFLCDLKNDMSRWSKSAIDFFGLPDEYMHDAGTIWAEHIHPDDRETYIEDIKAVFSGDKNRHEMEYRAKDKDGNYVVVTCKGIVIDDDRGNPALFAGTMVNHGIVDNIDPTTNLYNLYEFLRGVRLIREHKAKSIVLLLGLRQFSDINDIYGYTFGNKVLKAFGDKLREYFRDKGVVYRMDGSRFAVTTMSMSIEMIENLYLEIQDFAKHNIVIEGTQVTSAVCGGAVVVEDFSIDEHAVHASARFALDKSKKEKHGELVVVHNDYMNDNVRTVELINALRGCISDDCDGFYLCYQPVVSSGTGKLTGMEALLRWRKEPYGDVPPGIFIPWLEKDALFFELGNWILKQAFTEGKEFLKDHPEFVINVNIAYTQLERSDFRKRLLELLEITGFPPKNLCIELTERCQLLDIDFLRDEVTFLKSHGIKIALDDFGTGFSSLNLLRELPVDCIKIDRGFVAEIQSNKTDQSIVKAVTQCAKELDIQVCVEGIETEQLVEYMNNYPSTSYQGYYYSRPVPKEEFKKLSIY